MSTVREVAKRVEVLEARRPPIDVGCELSDRELAARTLAVLAGADEPDDVGAAREILALYGIHEPEEQAGAIARAKAAWAQAQAARWPARWSDRDYVKACFEVLGMGAAPEEACSFVAGAASDLGQ